MVFNFSVLSCVKKIQQEALANNISYTFHQHHPVRAKPPQTVAWGAASPSIKGYPTEKTSASFPCADEASFFLKTHFLFSSLAQQNTPPKN